MSDGHGYDTNIVDISKVQDFKSGMTVFCMSDAESEKTITEETQKESGRKYKPNIAQQHPVTDETTQGATADTAK